VDIIVVLFLRRHFIFLFLSLCLLHLSCTNSPTRDHVTQRPHLLILGLDGIGYAQMKKTQEGGYFRSFKPVSPMVASFPSISDPNWCLLMGLPPEASFTKEYFDIVENKPKGSLIDHVSHPPHYESEFDFRPEGALEHLASMTWSMATGLYWLDAMEKKLFETTDKSVFKAFIVNTDFLSHTKGEDEIIKYLVEMDGKLEEIRKRYKEAYGIDLEIVLVSDHGNVFLNPKSVLPAEELTKHGWHVVDHIEKEKDVGFVIPEILSFAAFYAKKNQEQKLAKDLSRVTGVHVAIAKGDGNSLDFYSQAGKGHSRVSFDRKRKTLNYKVLQGKDPFGHISLFKKGPITWHKYFVETLSTDYPNALLRAWQGFTINSQQKPSVLVSPILGYVFSNKTLELITNVMGLKSVHGSFHRKESLGIVMSTHRELPPLPPEMFLPVVLKQN